jgi:hypothetical protein
MASPWPALFFRDEEQAPPIFQSAYLSRFARSDWSSLAAPALRPREFAVSGRRCGWFWYLASCSAVEEGHTCCIAGAESLAADVSCPLDRKDVRCCLPRRICPEKRNLPCACVICVPCSCLARCSCRRAAAVAGGAATGVRSSNGATVVRRAARLVVDP